MLTQSIQGWHLVAARPFRLDRSRASNHLRHTTHMWHLCRRRAWQMEATAPNLGWCGGASTIDFRLMWSKAPIPSMESIKDLTTCATQSVPARVEARAAGRSSLGGALLCHCARDPPTESASRHMPLILPLPFINAVMAPIVQSADLPCSDALPPRIREVASSSSSNTLKRSLVSPANPAAEPLGALRRLLAHFSWSNSNCW